MKMGLWVIMCFQLLGVYGFSDVKEDIVLNCDKTEVYVGEPVRLNITIKRPLASKLKNPHIEKYTKAIFEIKDPKVEEKKLSSVEIQSSLTYTLIPFQVGTFDIGPIDIQIEEGRSEMKELKTNPQKVTVKSMLDPKVKEPDIRGPKPPLEIRDDFTWVLILLAIVVGLLLGGWLLSRKTRLDLVQEPLGSKVLIHPADEAIQKLEALEHSDDLKYRKMKRVYSSLSDILKGYLGKRYLFDSIEMTTEECRVELKRRRLLSTIFEGVHGLLVESDLAKFAKYEHDISVATNHIALTKKIVLETREP